MAEYNVSKDQQVLDTLARIQEVLEVVMSIDFSLEKIRVGGYFLRDILRRNVEDINYDYEEREFFGEPSVFRCDLTCKCNALHHYISYDEQYRRIMDRSRYTIDNFDAYIRALSRPCLPHPYFEPVYIYDEREEGIRLSADDFNENFRLDPNRVGLNSKPFDSRRRPRRVVKITVFLVNTELLPRNNSSVNNRNGSVLMYGLDTLIVDMEKFNYINAPSDDIYHIEFIFGLEKQEHDILLCQGNMLLSVLIGKEADVPKFTFLFFSAEMLKTMRPEFEVDECLVLNRSSRLFQELLRVRSCCQQHSGLISEAGNCSLRNFRANNPQEFYLIVYKVRYGDRETESFMRTAKERAYAMRERLHDALSNVTTAGGKQFISRTFVGSALSNYNGGWSPVLFSESGPWFKLYSPQCCTVLEKHESVRTSNSLPYTYFHPETVNCCW
jgi:hypothetical protein